MTPDERAQLLEEFAIVVPLDAEKRDEIVAAAEKSPELAKAMLTVYGDQDWSNPTTPAGTRVLQIIDALGGVGSAVGNVAGAVAGVKNI